MELGRHFIIEMFDCDRGALDDLEAIETAIERGAIRMGATVCGKVFHHFAPRGVTGVLVISESHISIHTWPEHGYAAVDIFTCKNMDPAAEYEEIVKVLRPKSSTMIEIKRGLLSGGAE